MRTRIFLTLLLLPLFAGMALAAGYYFQKPDWAEPTGDGRVLIYDPAANADKNVTWNQLRGNFTDYSTAARLARLAAVATSGSYPDLSNKPTIPAACVDIFDGAPGANATIAVGTTTTGPVGGYASLNLTGTPTNAVLNFTIPRGVAGSNGAPGRSPLFCNLSGGVRAVSYSSLGDNPLPIMSAFAVQLWNGASRVVAESWVWWTGGSSARITGSGTGTILPTVKPVYSQYSSNNYLAVTARYSSASTGRQYCTTGTPIAVTRAGLKGDTGAAGSPDTQAQILAKILIATDGAILTMQRGATEAATVAKLSVKDAAGNTRFYLDGAGAQFFKDVAGYNRVTVDTAGTISVRDTNNKLRMTITTNGEYVAYRGNGSTIAFAHYSTRLVL